MFDLKDESDIIPAELKDNSQKKKAKQLGFWIIILNIAYIFHQIQHIYKSDDLKPSSELQIAFWCTTAVQSFGLFIFYFKNNNLKLMRSIFLILQIRTIIGLIHLKIGAGADNRVIILNKLYISNIFLLNIFLQGLFDGEFNFKV